MAPRSNRTHDIQTLIELQSQRVNTFIQREKDLDHILPGLGEEIERIGNLLVQQAYICSQPPKG